MRLIGALVISGMAAIAFAGTAAAASCYDLWYERNSIYNDNGYCFKTEMGRDTFDNSDCWTSNPSLSRSERNRVNQIVREERRRGCSVNK
jgi:hypothetical protein